MLRTIRLGLALALGLVFLAAPIHGAVLNDSQIYFDPASITPYTYDRQVIDTRTGGYYTQVYTGVDGVKVLPFLKDNTYGPAYSYSQSDYFYTPNTDYFADLTGSTLTLKFAVPGLFHVELQSGSTTKIEAIFASVGFLEDPAGTDKSGAMKAGGFSPTADLFLISDEPGDAALEDAKKILDGNGQETDTMDDTQDIIDKAKAKSEELGRKIHLELVGHGREGSIRIGPGNRINVDDAAKKQELQELQEALDPYVNHITFVSCSTGGGTAGDEFLKILGSSIGKAQAWDKPITPVYDPENPTKGYFAVDKDATYKTYAIPLPAAAWGGMALFGCMAAARLRRRAA
jgi:hypothetical protein